VPNTKTTVSSAIRIRIQKILYQLETNTHFETKAFSKSQRPIGKKQTAAMETAAGKAALRMATTLPPHSSTVCIAEKWTLLGSLVSLLTKTGLIPKMRNYRVTELETLISDCGFENAEAQTLSKLSERFIVARKI
jgi:hypothetical protein